MKPKTEEFLYLLLWGAETLARPTFRNLDESFEGWAYRTGLNRQLARLEKQKLIATDLGAKQERRYRLTETGRFYALGQRDPEAQWNRSWDGLWRLVLFDIPEQYNKARVRLRRFLKERGFGYLQNSVWITPDPLGRFASELRTYSEDVELLITLEAHPASGEADTAIVKGAWDFDHINGLYERHIHLLAKLPKIRAKNANARDRLRQWAKQERLGWMEAVTSDPLLPSKLQPSGYLGKRAWQIRARVLKEAANCLL